MPLSSRYRGSVQMMGCGWRRVTGSNGPSRRRGAVLRSQVYRPARMPKRRVAPPPDPDVMVVLDRGCIEDRMLRTGAVVEIMVYPPGAVIPLVEALARGIDDYTLYVPPEPVLLDDLFAGPGPAVRDPWTMDH